MAVAMQLLNVVCGYCREAALAATVAILVFLAAAAWAWVVATHLRSCLNYGRVAALLALGLAGHTTLRISSGISLLALGVLWLATTGRWVARHGNLRR